MDGSAGRGRRLVGLVVLLAAGALAPRLSASQLFVEPRTLLMNGLATITVSLEGDAAERDSVAIPLRNLVLAGEPSVSSEFGWVNGVVSRRKTFRYRARAVAPGTAQVGPIVLVTQDGRREVLPAVTIEVVADRASGSNDPETVLRELLASGRHPFFVVAEADRTRATVGQPVVVTWSLYAALRVQDSQVSAVPDLRDFWSEELKRPDGEERVWVGETVMQRVPIRRAVLFPLRSGRLRIEGLTVDGAVMVPRRSGPLAIFEGDLVETTFTSAPIEIDVAPLPPGPPVDAIGALELDCSAPLQRGGGPVRFDVVLRGRGNVRGAAAPHFDGPLDGTSRVEGGSVTLPDEPGSIEMTRRWQFLVFPNGSGMFEVPALSMRIFDPEAGQRRELRCARRILDVTVAARPQLTGRPAQRSSAPVKIPWIPIAASAALMAAAAFAIPRVLRRIGIRREARRIARDAAPDAIRERVDERLPVPPSVLLAEASDRGDAYRSLCSMLDAARHDRDIAADASREIEDRLAEFLAALR